MQTTARLVMGLVVVVAACGSSSESGGNAPAADAGASSSGASGNASSSGATSSTSSSGATSSSSSSGATDGGSSGDAGVTIGDTTTQTCGGAPCTIADHLCCVSNGAADKNCIAKAQTCGAAGATDNASLSCSGQANCAPNTKCCIRVTATGTVSECKATCAAGEGQLCDSAAAVTGCSADSGCSSENIEKWNLPDTYATCGGVGTSP